MSSIIGVTVGTPVPQSDWNQTNPNRADYIKNKPDLDSMFGRTSSQINKLDKRVTNLEQGILPSPFVTDDGTAYQKSVPTNALPYAEVSKVGGMTRKCTNLLSFTEGVKSHGSGTTLTIDSNGVCTLDGIVTRTHYHTLGKVSTKGTLTFSGIKGGDASSYYFQVFNDTKNAQIAYVYDGELTFDNTDGDIIGIYIYASGGATLSNIKLYPMLNEGTTALPYEPYFEGLRSAPVTEVESVGANLFDITKAIDASYGGSKIEVVGNNITYTYGTNTTEYSFAFSCWIEVEPNTDYSVVCKSTSLKSCYVYTDELYGNSLGSINAYGGGIFNSGNNRKLLVGFYSAPSYRTGTSEVVSEIMISKGSTALPYSPYVRNTIPISEAVQALDGYGWGVNESVYNYIDWDKKQFVKRVERVDMGSLEWSVSSSAISRYQATISNIVNVTKDSADIFCESYTESTSGRDKTIFHYANRVYAHDSAYTDATALKSALSGVMLYYELADPIITDISNLITEDNYIGVESGGTVTMVNEYGYAVPSEITYQAKGEA